MTSKVRAPRKGENPAKGPRAVARAAEPATATATMEPTPEAPAPADDKPAEPAEGVRAKVAAAAAADTTVYTVTGELDPKRKGLVVKVFNTLKSLGPATVSQVADALVSSGEWTSKAVPVVPIRTWLRQFAETGIAKTDA